VKQLGTYLTLLLSHFFNLLPKIILYRFADVFYIILFDILRYRRKVVFENLRNSFPEKSDKEIYKIARKFYLHLSDTFVENCALLTMSKERTLKFVEIEKTNLINDLFNKDKNVVVVTGHYGNWEMFLAIPLLSSHQVLGVYKPLNNKAFDKVFFKMRQKFGAIPVTMHDSYKTVLDFKHRKELCLLGLIADQRPPKKGGHYWTTFLNQETAILLGPEKISKKLNTAVVFLYLEKPKRGSYILKTKLLFENAKDCSPNEITETHLRFLEKLIIDKPQYWLWSHKRWKHKRSNNVVNLEQ
jgi:KDO2-lipid IV(A) lauroyltransferase